MPQNTRPYVGLKSSNGPYETFRSVTVPTAASHGRIYVAVIGPFRTMRGARFMAAYGRDNPHCRTVSEAESLALHHAANEAVKLILG